MKHCSLHDVVYPEGKSCWCCDLQKKKSAESNQATKPTEQPKTFSNPNG